MPMRRPYNVLKIPGTSVSTVGLTAPGAGEGAGDGFEEVTLLDRRMGYYKKCVVRHDRLVGAVLIGDNAEFAAFRWLIETGSELDEQREQLAAARGGGTAGHPARATWCAPATASAPTTCAPRSRPAAELCRNCAPPPAPAPAAAPAAPRWPRSWRASPPRRRKRKSRPRAPALARRCHAIKRTQRQPRRPH